MPPTTSAPTDGASPAPFLEADGFCPICEDNRHFTSAYDWLRDHFLCSGCGSIPRERALMVVLDLHAPDWRELTVHESSPANRGVSPKLARQCRDYSVSQLFPGVAVGETHQGVRCENLERMSFADESFDVFLTQDVLEHVFEVECAVREIARVLRPGGRLISTVPLVNRARPSVRRATRQEDGSVRHLLPPEYHGNPVDSAGALVTWDHGFDLAARITRASGMVTIIHSIDDLTRGIRAELNEVLVSFKAAPAHATG